MLCVITYKAYKLRAGFIKILLIKTYFILQTHNDMSKSIFEENEVQLKQKMLSIMCPNEHLCTLRVCLISDGTEYQL